MPNPKPAQLQRIFDRRDWRATTQQRIASSPWTKTPVRSNVKLSMSGLMKSKPER